MLSASLLTCAAFISFILITQRGKIEKLNRLKKNEEKGEEMEIEKKEGSPPQYDAQIQHIPGNMSPLGVPGNMTPLGLGKSVI